MKTVLYIFTFFMSAGISGLGIITAYRLKNNPKYKYAPSLFYMTMFMAAFGFYGIWGNILINALFRSVTISDHLLVNLLSVIPVMGLPLLIVCWFLMIKFGIELVDKQLKSWWSISYFILCIVCLFFIVLHLKNKVAVERPVDKDLLYEILLIVHFIFILVVSSIWFIYKNEVTSKAPVFWLASSLALPAILFGLTLFMSYSHWSVLLAAIIFYFSQTAILPGLLYFKYGGFEVSRTAISGFESFCKAYEISKREAEIIEQICQGKTNKEISESLFITLQTVKDHASRIYLKTEVSNRVQLTNLVREKVKSHK